MRVTISWVIVCCCALFGQSQGSAIPMWELLGRQEKMSFLYSIFSKLVDDHCETSSLEDCNRTLLRYGLKSLKNLHEDVLDHLDPYQKNSHHMIWETMLKGHPLATSPPDDKHIPATPAPRRYNDAAAGDPGSEAAATADLDVYQLPPPEGYHAEVEKTVPQDVEVIFESAARTGGVLLRKEYQGDASSEMVPLTGPVVVRVRLDGTLVEEEKSEHYDEDLRQYLLAQAPIPESI